MTRTKFLVLVALGVVGYIGWAVMVYLDPSQRGDFLKLHVAVVTGITMLALRDMGPPSPPAPAPVTPAPVPRPQPSVVVPFDPSITP